jgi:hypothetical protein
MAEQNQECLVLAAGPSFSNIPPLPQWIHLSLTSWLINTISAVIQECSE